MGQIRRVRVYRKRQRRVTEASEQLLVARRAARLQLQQLAAALGVHPRTITRWETGFAHPSKEQWGKTIAYLAGIVPAEAVALAKAAGVASPFPETPPVDLQAIEEGLLRAADLLDESPRRVRAAVRELAKVTARARGTLADLARAAEEKDREGAGPRSGDLASAHAVSFVLFPSRPARELSPAALVPGRGALCPGPSSPPGPQVPRSLRSVSVEICVFVLPNRSGPGANISGPNARLTPMNSSSWRLTLNDFRVYRTLDLSPEGVSVLAAPNGAGKTTLNDALRLLGTLFTRDMEAALTLVSARLLRRVQASGVSPVELSLSVGDVTWRLSLPVDSQGLTGRYGEELLRGGEVVVRAAMHQKDWHYGPVQRTMPLDERRCCARIVWDEERPSWLEPLQRMLTTLRVYDHYHLNLLTKPWERGGRHTYLYPTGTNLWTVLDNWKGSRVMGGRYNWVLERARLAFPSLISDIDFSPFLSIYRPDAPDQGMPPELLAAGLLTGLGHLTAVAGAEDGATLTFDEVEDALHPHAIRSILQAMEEQAEARGLTILLTTHSPVVLNQFKGKESHIYIIERDLAREAPSDVVALDQAREERWLAHFEPGDLYAAEDIAAQGGPSSAATRDAD